MWGFPQIFEQNQASRSVLLPPPTAQIFGLLHVPHETMPENRLKALGPMGGSAQRISHGGSIFGWRQALLIAQMAQRLKQPFR
jgi:hypothetical protein